MSTNVKSFFDRLTGNFNHSEHGRDENFAEEPEELKEEKKPEKQDWLSAETEEEGQLSVDMYHSPNEITIQAMTAGVKPEDLDVSINQGMITLKGKRQKTREIIEDNYYYRELYWGCFSRSILLPQDLDLEKIEAGIKNGVLTVHIPKTNKEKIQKVKIKSE